MSDVRTRRKRLYLPWGESVFRICIIIPVASQNISRWTGRLGSKGAMDRWVKDVACVFYFVPLLHSFFFSFVKKLHGRKSRFIKHCWRIYAEGTNDPRAAPDPPDETDPPSRPPNIYEGTKVRVLDYLAQIQTEFLRPRRMRLQIYKSVLVCVWRVYICLCTCVCVSIGVAR